jgi:hypothetical protein
LIEDAAAQCPGDGLGLAKRPPIAQKKNGEEENNGAQLQKALTT